MPSNIIGVRVLTRARNITSIPSLHDHLEMGWPMTDRQVHDQPCNITENDQERSMLSLEQRDAGCAASPSLTASSLFIHRPNIYELPYVDLYYNIEHEKDIREKWGICMSELRRM